MDSEKAAKDGSVIVIRDLTKQFDDITAVFKFLTGRENVELLGNLHGK